MVASEEGVDQDITGPKRQRVQDTAERRRQRNRQRYIERRDRATPQEHAEELARRRVRYSQRRQNARTIPLALQRDTTAPVLNDPIQDEAARRIQLREGPDQHFAATAVVPEVAIAREHPDSIASTTEVERVQDTAERRRQRDRQRYIEHRDRATPQEHAEELARRRVRYSKRSQDASTIPLALQLDTTAPVLHDPVEDVAPPRVYTPVTPPPITGPQNQRQRRAQASAGRTRSRLLRVARGYHDTYTIPPGSRHLLPPRKTCPHCAAHLWPGETGTVCCNSGQIVLPAFEEPPPELSQLLTNNSFLDNIRRYNSAFAFTSMGASVKVGDRVRQDISVLRPGGPPTIRIQGTLCHRIGSLEHGSNDQPRYAQLYYYDPAQEQLNFAARVAARVHTFREITLDPHFVTIIQKVLTDHNPLAQSFCHAWGRLHTPSSATTSTMDVAASATVIANDEHAPTMRFCIHGRLPGVDHRRYNRPTADEVAGILILPSAGAASLGRDLLLQERESHRLRAVYERNQMFDALQYPLLHPYGEVGWTHGIAKQRRRSGTHQSDRSTDHVGDAGDAHGDDAESSAHHVSPREYASYRLCTRAGEQVNVLLHRAGRLFQQYCVDQYCKMETNRLQFQRSNQVELRAAAIGGLIDLAGADTTVEEHDNPTGGVHARPPTIGTRIMLSPSYVGGDRYMRAQYQNAMAIVRTFGKPDLFITVTCNPKWPDITEYLMPRQKVVDRPDLAARVFRLKLRALLKDLTDGVLGVQVARIHVIEFQKRGLPHAHILMILSEADKPSTADDIDRLVSAEIPDKDRHPELHETIVTAMLHGPCGTANPQAPCMNDNVCSKHYPREYCEETHTAGSGYPVYRRRASAASVVVHGRTFDSRHVVPYNPWLCHKYNCHINVEICTTISSVKYLYKYVYKGHDRIAVTLDHTSAANDGTTSNRCTDEIQEYLDARYISAIESCWRLFRFEVQQKTHTVLLLPVHLENQQTVIFRQRGSFADAIARRRHTMLTRFFELASNDAFARTLTYQEVPCHYRFTIPRANQLLPWHSRPGPHWIRRVHRDRTIIGRLTSCSPNLMERYSLRLLLCYRRGPRSFDELRTTADGVRCVNFQEAASLAGLLNDDSEWERALEEAISFQMPSQLRQLFAILLLTNSMQQPRRLWDKYVDHLSEDYRHRDRMRYTEADSEQNRILREQAVARTLHDIDRFLRGSTTNQDLTSYSTMPQLADHPLPAAELAADSVNTLLDAARSYDRSTLEGTLSTVSLMNEEQRSVYDIITATITAVTTGAIADATAAAACKAAVAASATSGNHADAASATTAVTEAIAAAAIAATTAEAASEAVRAIFPESVPHVLQRLFFLDGPGGTGKSFVLEAILAFTRRQAHIALATASSGIAAVLLTGGQTVHSTFKLGLDLNETSTGHVPAESKRAELLRLATLIVWDEVSMSSRFALEAVDRLLRDLTGLPTIPFGGKIVLLCGDFRQLLPVVPKGTEAQMIDQCIKRSILWPLFYPLKLTTNMRVRTAPNIAHADQLRQFGDFLLRVGEGRHEQRLSERTPLDDFPGGPNAFACIPHDMLLPLNGDIDQDRIALVNTVYEDLPERHVEASYFGERAIVTPLNVDVEAINKTVLDRMPHEVHEYLSVDSLADSDGDRNHKLQPEHLHALNPSGVPVHQLRLKVNAPVLLLRNLNSERGLCNGTRLQICALKPHCIQARILTGQRAGDMVLLPRIICSSCDVKLPFQIRRKQFPLQLCFTISIKIVQGQSLHHLAIYLPQPVFAHGQLYVALSRVTSRENVKLLIGQQPHKDDDGVYTTNVVYRQLL